MVVEFPEIPGEMASAARARWLAELAEALEAAQTTLAGLGLARSSPEGMELHVRIETVRLEVQALRLRTRRLPSGDIAPVRTQHPPWERNGTDS